MKLEKKGFSSFDWCVLVLIAALIALVSFAFWKQSSKVTPNVEVEYLLRLEASDHVPLISVGDEVRNENGTLLFGRVSKVSTRQFRTAFLRDGRPVYDAVEGLSEAEMTVRVTAEKTDAYRVGGVRICAGNSGTYRIGQMLVSGARVIRLSEVGA